MIAGNVFSATTTVNVQVADVGSCCLQESNREAFPMVELRILGNHGNKEYTCLYRFRVHGVSKL